MRKGAEVGVLLLWADAVLAPKPELKPNEWIQIERSELGPGFSPGLVWAPNLRRFIFFSGSISHHFKGERPYDVMSFDPADWKWRNELPPGVQQRGGETGMVRDVDFKTPYFAMEDAEGLVRPNRRHMTMYYQYAYAPWDNRVYALICGRTLCYDPQQREWKDLKPATSPMPEVGTARVSLSWAALCSDTVNRSLALGKWKTLGGTRDHGRHAAHDGL